VKSLELMAATVVAATLTGCQPQLIARPDDVTPALQTVAAKLDTPVELRLSETAAFKLDDAPLSIRFEAVPEDSRCPVGVTCVWEGDAVVRLTAVKSADRATPELHTNANFAREQFFAGVRIRLVQLAPVPTAAGPVKPAEYVASIVVERVA
jgi:hypothetical protein